MDSPFTKLVLQHQRLIANLIQEEDVFRQAADLILAATDLTKQRIWFIGNGASATLASHFATDFAKGSSGRIRTGVITDPAMFTALTNDLADPHDWMAEALRLNATNGDRLIAISSSGKSPNVVRAVRQARSDNDQPIFSGVITLTGFSPDNPLRQLGDVNFWVDSKHYNPVEAMHTAILGILCDLVLDELSHPKTAD